MIKKENPKEEDMYPYVKANLRRYFRLVDGWILIPKDRWDGYETDFTLERRLKGKVQRVIVEVKINCTIHQKDVDQLNLYVKKLSGNNVEILGKILAVPSGADTIVVPDDIIVMVIRTFVC